jgi:hypothetical protein
MAPAPELVVPQPDAHLWAQATAIQHVSTLVSVVLDFKSNVFHNWCTFFFMVAATYASRITSPS